MKWYRDSVTYFVATTHAVSNIPSCNNFRYFHNHHCYKRVRKAFLVIIIIIGILILISAIIIILSLSSFCISRIIRNQPALGPTYNVCVFRYIPHDNIHVINTYMVPHATILWSGYIEQLYVKYSTDCVNMGE